MSTLSNHWDERFNRDSYVYGTEPNPFIQYISEQLEGENVLTIAEGEGRNAVYLAEQGFNVTAWDYSKVGLEKTEALAQQRGVHVNTELVDLEAVDWQAEQWDIIVNVWGHVGAHAKQGLLRGVEQAVKSGGQFVTEMYSVHQLDYKTGGPPDLDMLYTPEDILHHFPDWKYIHFYYGEAERNEGFLHTGRCHIIQALLSKNR